MRCRGNRAHGVVVAAALVFAGGLLTACGPSPLSAPGGSSPDVTPDGQVAYACGLAGSAAEQLQSAADWEDLRMIGEDTEDVAIELGAIGGLLGAMGAYQLADHAVMSEASVEILKGVASHNIDAMPGALATIEAECEAASVVPLADAQLTPERRISYACALAAYVIDEHGDANEWGSFGEEPAFHEAGSVGALLGGMNGHVMKEAPDVSEAGGDVVTSVSRMDMAGLNDGLEAVVSGCEAL
ncbi:hypothetical protein [Microbacterium halotolerans]|uniref:hypothetical protein n=1 Tax=Microbacterium halotolerans TaxID=246613 RepID=UPI000E6AD4E1|nr:hypothetical protein [Microbacterium halotolerans]